MKNLFIAILCISQCWVYGQNLLVDGAEWHYNLRIFFSPNKDVNRCYIDGDTVIQNRLCLKFFQERSNCNGRPLRNYLLKEGQQVFFFDEDDGTFKLLYDFSLEVGDTMTYETGIHFWDTRRKTHYIRIDSIGSYRNDVIDKKLFHVSYGEKETDGGITFYKSTARIIEDIGSTVNYFHFPDDTGFCDFDYTDSLRCFSAPGFPTIKFSETACLYTPIHSIDSDMEIKVFPNPFIDELQILSTAVLMKSYIIIIYDFLGNEVLTYNRVSGPLKFTIDLADLTPSCYYVAIMDSESGRLFHGQKIIKVEN